MLFGIIYYLNIARFSRNMLQAHYTHTHTHRDTGCPGGNVPDLGRMFSRLKYTDITQNTYIRIETVTEIMAKEKCGLLAVPRTLSVSRDV
jgi:hypothetical protein